MLTMLRKLNFTERGKIARTNVRVALRRDDDGTLLFDPHVSFEGVDVAPSCRVFIEAWYRTSFMRFDCGSVEAFAPPRDRRLTEIEGTRRVHFRVKVVDNRANDHRIVAVADDIVVSIGTEEATGRLPLLPVNFSDALGQQAWRVAFESSGPVLELNTAVAGIEELAKNDPAFLALVYPTAVRVVLTQILLVDEHEAYEEGDEWPHLWLRWGERFASPLPADREEAAFWIEDVVAAFCGRQTLIDRWRGSRAEGA
jgi:hypothetical protein